jgi:hypothetical protein
MIPNDFQNQDQRFLYQTGQSELLLHFFHTVKTWSINSLHEDRHTLLTSSHCSGNLYGEIQCKELLVEGKC